MEVTESVLVTEGSVAHAVLHDLQALGIRIAIDDFGIGYSSLSYLAKLPVHSLKVDRSFIAGLGSPGMDASIVTAMVELAHKLGLAVVAEGVETEAELAELKRAHCDEAQGFLLGPPRPLRQPAPGGGPRAPELTGGRGAKPRRRPAVRPRPGMAANPPCTAGWRAAPTGWSAGRRSRW